MDIALLVGNGVVVLVVAVVAAVVLRRLKGPLELTVRPQLEADVARLRSTVEASSAAQARLQEAVEHLDEKVTGVLTTPVDPHGLRLARAAVALARQHFPSAQGDELIRQAVPLFHELDVGEDGRADFTLRQRGHWCKLAVSELGA